MESAWARALRKLQPDAQRLVRTLAILGGPTVSLVSVAAALEMSEPDAAEVVSVLTADHWGAITEDRFEVAIPAREYLAELAQTVPAAKVDQVLTLVAAVLQPYLDKIPPLAVRADAVSVIRTAGRHRHGDIVAAVARIAWCSPIMREDLTWCRELAECGEDAAIDSRQPELLIELLNNSAEIYASVDDWPGAELAWLRALALVEDLGDIQREVHFLNLLTTNYLNWKRPHKAADMLHGIVRIHERANDPIKTAQAQAAFARVMANANRADAAVNYLKRAHHLLRQLPDDNTEVPTLHATILADLGEIHARSGAINSARTCYRQALTLVVETDIPTANRIRSMQETLRLNTTR